MSWSQPAGSALEEASGLAATRLEAVSLEVDGPCRSFPALPGLPAGGDRGGTAPARSQARIANCQQVSPALEPRAVTRPGWASLLLNGLIKTRKTSIHGRRHPSQPGREQCCRPGTAPMPRSPQHWKRRACRVSAQTGDGGLTGTGGARPVAAAGSRESAARHGPRWAPTQSSALSGLRLVRIGDHGPPPGSTETRRPDRFLPAVLEEGPSYLCR